MPCPTPYVVSPRISLANSITLSLGCTSAMVSKRTTAMSVVSRGGKFCTRIHSSLAQNSTRAKKPSALSPAVSVVGVMEADVEELVVVDVLVSTARQPVASSSRT